MINKMEIPLVNTYLEIKLSRKPKLKKLKKELSDFFKENEIEGIKIANFDISDNYEIIPNLRGRKFLYLFDDYSKKIKAIGKKYNIPQLRFSLSCYGK